MVGIVSKRIEEVNKAMMATTEYLKTVPSKRELCHHQATMDEKIAQVEEIYLGLTTAMEQLK